jgi:tripartite-type tricarboxylate transporter receptor subunit TctC
MIARCAALLFAAVSVTLPAAAQEAATGYPEHPVRFIVTTPAGGSGDILGRIVGHKLSEMLRQQFYIDIRAGAGGIIANEILARSAPDGYTIGMVTTSSLVVASIVTPDLSYDPIKDIAPISMIGEMPYVLAVHPGVSAKTAPELVALAKANPHALSIGTNDPTSLGHLTDVLFASRTGIELNQVFYRSSAQAVLDVIAGRIDMQFGTLPPTIPLIRAGQVRAIGTTGQKRVAALPDVATLAEQGIPDVESLVWIGIAAPAGVPPAITAKVNNAITEILKMPDTIEALAEQGMEAKPGPPDDLRRRVQSDLIKWRDVAAAAGIIGK